MTLLETLFGLGTDGTDDSGTDDSGTDDSESAADGGVAADGSVAADGGVAAGGDVAGGAGRRARCRNCGRYYGATAETCPHCGSANKLLGGPAGGTHQRR